MGFFSKIKFKSTKSLAEGGDKLEQYKLAQYYYYGKEVEQDYAQALHWYVEAARQHYMYGTKPYDKANLDAMYMVAVCYNEGKGVPKNPEFAKRIIRNLYWKFERGLEDYIYKPSAETLENVKRMYEEYEKENLRAKSPELIDYTRAVKENNPTKDIIERMEIAAEHGDIGCLVQLSSLYQNPRKFEGIIQINVEKSVAYLERAAELGCLYAYEDLAEMFSGENRNKTIPIDLERAKSYLKKGISQGITLGDESLIIKYTYKLSNIYYRSEKDYKKVISLLLPLTEKSSILGEFNLYSNVCTRLASAYRNLNCFKEAIQFYEKALELPDGDPLAYFDSNICEYIGDIYKEELNDKAKANEWYYKGIKFDNNCNCRSAVGLDGY